MKYTVLTGSPVIGYIARGIFDTHDEAYAYGDNNKFDADWEIMEIDDVQQVTKTEMIDKLIDDDLNDWRSSTQQQNYIADMLREGFQGYNKQTYEQLKDEMQTRGFL